MRAFFAVFKAQLQVFLRNPLDLFVTVVLPLALVLLFGVIWGGRERPTRLGIVFAGAAEPLLSVLAEFPSLVWEEHRDEQELTEAVARRKVDLGLVWDGKNVKVLLDRSRIQDNPGFEILARRVARALELHQAKVAPPLQPEKVPVGKLVSPTWYHYLVPGLMVIAVLQAGVFAVAGRLAGMRETGVLQRLLTTPVSGWAVLGGVGAVRMLVGFSCAGLNFLFAQSLFNTTFSVHGGLLLLYAVASGLGGMGLGALVTGLTRRPGSATALGTILVQIMLFLSGIYIPFDFLPPGLRVIGRHLPTYHLAQGMRAALGVVEPEPSTLLASLMFALVGGGAFLVLGRIVLQPGSTS